MDTSNHFQELSDVDRPAFGNHRSARKLEKTILELKAEVNFYKRLSTIDIIDLHRDYTRFLEEVHDPQQRQLMEYYAFIDVFRQRYPSQYKDVVLEFSKSI